MRSGTGRTPDVLELVRRDGPQILRTARRYSATSEDAEDAYQRGLEILLTKPPECEQADLVPWLKTVVKHEAYAIRRQRERAAPTGQQALADAAGSTQSAHDEAERHARLELGAEALHRLKPQETRCLLLRAEGYTYKQICKHTGFSYTKVNRCLTEGRRAFLERVRGIEAGSECDRLAPLLSAFADGEAHGDVDALRRHLKGCLACRSRLREYRAVPARVAAAVPPALVAASHPPGHLRGAWHALAGAVQERLPAFGDKAHSASELAVAQKLGVVAAASATLAGGGAAAHRIAAPQADARAPGHVRLQLPPDVTKAPPAAPAQPPPAATAPAPTSRADPQAKAPVPRLPIQPRPAPAPAPTPAREFDPAAGAAASHAAPRPAGASHASSGGGTSGGGGSSEFAP